MDESNGYRFYYFSNLFQKRSFRHKEFENREALAKLFQQIGKPSERQKKIPEIVKFADISHQVTDSSAPSITKKIAQIDLCWALLFWLNFKGPIINGLEELNASLLRNNFSTTDAINLVKKAWQEVDKKTQQPEFLHVPEYLEPSKLENSTDEVSLSALDHHSIPLVGRDDEIVKLNEFMNSEALFSICVVVGSPGSGKTRLTSEWMRPFVKSNEWHAGFVKSAKAENWNYKNWQLKANTLIIVDYVYRFDAVIRQIVDTQKKFGSYKIRLLILDHIYPELLKNINLKPSHEIVAAFNEDPIFPSAIAQTIGEVDVRKSMFFKHSPIELSEFISDDPLRSIIASACEFNPTEKTIEWALKDLATMGDKVRLPLFAALCGKNITRGNPLGRHKREISNRKEIVFRYLIGTNRLPWISNTGSSRYNHLGIWIGCFVVLATIRGSFSYDETINKLQNSLKFRESFKLWDKEDKKAFKARCNRIIASNNYQTMQSFKPDILGESFFLLFLEEINSETEHEFVFDFFIDELFNFNKSDLKEGNHIQLLSFFARLHRNVFHNRIFDGHDQKYLNFMRKVFVSKYQFLPSIKDSIKQFCVMNLVSENFFSADSNLNHFYQLYQTLQSKKISKIIDNNTIRTLEIFLVHIFDKFLKTEKDEQIFLKLVKLYNKKSTDMYFIHIAARRNMNNLVNFLIRKGEHVDKKSKKSSETPLTIACAGIGNEVLAESLLKKGANPDHREGLFGTSALYKACKLEQLETVAVLLKFKARTDIIFRRMSPTILTIACMSEQRDMIDLLIANGADPNQSLDKDTTVLINAIQEYDEIQAKWLLYSGANPNLASLSCKRSPLGAAVLYGDEDTVTNLLAAGADIKKSNKVNGFLLIEKAQKYRHKKIEALLLKANNS